MATFAKSSFSANNYYDMARQQRQFPQGKYILRSQKKSPDGQQYGIYLYYYWRGMHVRRSVDMYVAQKDWNQEANGGAGEFRSSYGPNYKVRNAYLKELMHDIDCKIMDYIKLHDEIDGDTIEAFVISDSSDQMYSVGKERIKQVR
jgi:hypothetical protein